MIHKQNKSEDIIQIESKYPVKAGNLNEFVLEIKLGAAMGQGEGFLLAVPVGWTYPQNDNPLEAGFTSIHISESIEYDFIAPQSMWQLRLMKFSIKNGILPKGTDIKIIYGDTSKGGPGTEVGHVVHKNVPFPYTRETNNTMDFTPLDCSPSVDILPNQPVKMTLRAKSNQVVGEYFELYAGYEDDFGNCTENFTGRVEFINNGILVEKEKLEENDRGIIKVKTESNGVHHIAVNSKDMGRTFLSNPIEVDSKVMPYKLYFGEIHGHTDFSDAVGTLDEFYQYGRDFARLDFCAASNHDVGHNKNALSWNYHNMTCEKWRETVKKASEYNQPGRFVTFSGLEFSFNNDGHMNIYFLKDDENSFKHFIQYMSEGGDKWPVKQKLIDTRGIVEAFKGVDYILIPHHPGMNFSGFDVSYESGNGSGYVEWKNIIDAVSPVVEVYSKHGSSVRANDLRPLRGQTFGCFMEDVLKTGRKFGFIGGSDTHYGNPGSRQGYGPYATLQYPAGLAAVYSKELTREGIFEALKARRCYATTYARIILKFEVNGHFMGEDFTLEKGKPELLIEAHGEGRIKKVDIFKNGDLLYTESPVAMRQDIRLEYTDESPLREHNYYYVRILEAEGDIAWSSPVFVRKPL